MSLVTSSISAPRLRRAVPVALVLALTLAAGCDGSDGDSTSKARSTPSTTPTTPAAPVQPTTPAATLTAKPVGADDPALKAFYEQKLTWAKCPDDKKTKSDEGAVECARLRVPLDYANPAAETLELQAYRKRAGGDRLGILAVDPGGPGSGVLSMTRRFAVDRAEVGARYDVVGIDPRGTVDSAPVDCVDDAGIERLRSLDPTPDDAAELDRIGAFYKEFADGCTAKSGTLLPHLGTQDVVSDLDVLRGVLGEDKLNYFGYSYGTFIGAVYLEKFPKHTGRFVLDSPIDPAMDRISGARDQAAGFEQAYRAFVTDCLKQDDCPFTGGVEEAIKRTADRLHELGTTPLRAKGGRTVGEGEASYAISMATYSEQNWRDLRLTLQIYLGKDADRALAMTDYWLQRDKDGKYPWDHTDSNITINCADGRMLTVAEADKLAKEVQATMPVAGPGVVWSFAADCRPNGTDRARPIKAAGAPPVLVVGSTGDPATPYGQAQALTPQLPGSVLLTRENTGHGAYASGSTCIDAAVEKYLFTGELPAAGTRCK